MRSSSDIVTEVERHQAWLPGVFGSSAQIRIRAENVRDLMPPIVVAAPIAFHTPSPLSGGRVRLVCLIH